MNSDSYKHIKKNIIWNVLRTGSNIVFPSIAFVYITKVTGTDGYGKLSFAKNYVTNFSLIAMLGINSYAVNKAASIRDDKRKLSIFTKEILVLNVTTMVVAYVLLFISVFGFKQIYIYHELIIIYSIEILFQVIGIDWFYNAIEKFDYIAVRTFIIQLLVLVTTIILVKDVRDIKIYVFIQSFGTGLVGMLNFLYSRKFVTYNISFDLHIYRHLWPVLKLAGMMLFINIFRLLDTLMLGIMKDDNAVGLYSVGDKMCSIITSMIVAISAVIFPRISYYVETHKEKKNMELIYTTSRGLLLISIPISIGVIILAKPIVLLLSGEEFAESITTTRILSMRILLSPVNAFFAMNVFVPLKMENKSIVVTGLAAVMDFILNVILIPPMSQNGAAISTVCAEIVEFVMILFFVNNFVSRIKLLASMVKYTVVSMGFIIVDIIVSYYFKNNIIVIIIVMCISTVYYFGLLYFLHDNLVVRIALDIKKRLHLND